MIVFCLIVVNSHADSRQAVQMGHVGYSITHGDVTHAMATNLGDVQGLRMNLSKDGCALDRFSQNDH